MPAGASMPTSLRHLWPESPTCNDVYWPTYPQLYVNGELLGGCDIALEMYRSGELKKLLSEAGAVTA